MKDGLFRHLFGSGRLLYWDIVWLHKRLLRLHYCSLLSFWANAWVYKRYDGVNPNHSKLLE